MKAASSTAPGRGAYRAAAAWASAGRIAFGTSLAGLGILQLADGEWAALFMAAALSALAVLFAVQARIGTLPRSASSRQPTGRIC